MAVDGCTHERHAIEEWFKMKDVQLVEAEIELQLTPVQVHVQRGIVEPSGMTIADLSLIPNNSARTITRPYGNDGPFVSAISHA